MSSSQSSNSTGNTIPSSAVTTVTPPPTTTNSIGYPTPQLVPFGYGYSSHHQGHDNVLQQPNFYYQWLINHQLQQWNPQWNPQYSYLLHQPHASHQQPISYSRNQQGTSRKPRVVYTNAQLAMLEESFKQDKYISKSDCVELAKALGISEEQIKTWFQNRRYRAKKMNANRTSGKN